MGNQYHDELGRFCSRENMRAALRKSAETGNVATWIRLKEDLRKADISNNYLPSTRIGLIHPAVKFSQSDVEERDEILSTGDVESIQKWITNRINNPEYIDLLDERDVMKERARVLNEEHKMLDQQWQKDPTQFDYQIVRAKGFEAKDAYEELQILKAQANEYKDVTATAVYQLNEIIEQEQKINGTYREYTADTLNDLVATGDFPSGSREWLELRQNGIGGSDVGKIIGSTGVSGYDARDYREVFTSKVEPLTEEEIAEQEKGHSDFTGYAGRGNAWEGHILNRFAENHPELNITHCKTSWKHSKETYHLANFDGLMTDENGVPNGILEIKTASDSSKWKDTSLGLEGVPPAYKYQALWYADAAGFEKGAVAVMIDDREYREYPFTITPELREEMNEIKNKVEKFNQEVKNTRNGVPSKDPRVKKDFSGRVGFSDTFVRNALKKYDTSFKEAAVLREETIEETKKRYSEIVGDSTDMKVLREGLIQLYTEKPISERKQKLVNIDIETSSSSPTAGHILEVGISLRSPQGEELDKFSKLYGLPARAMKATSTGAVEVHGITEGMIAKKRTFQHKEEQKKVLGLLKSGILVAHNANYEVKWLRQELEGFAEAEKRGEIKVLDTKSLTYRLLTSTKNSTLNSFVENYGRPYVNAHRAYNDSAMMGDALTDFLKDPFRKNS